MRFANDKNYKEVSLLDGLKALAENTKAKLYSDGLESNEYLYYDEIKGICFEDGCVVRRDPIESFLVLKSLKWPAKSKFYLDELEE